MDVIAPPLSMKGFVPVMIIGAGIIFWADHGFAQGSLDLYQDPIGKSLSIGV